MAGQTDEARAERYMRAVLRERGFRRLLAVRTLGQIGDGLFQGGLAGSVLFNPEQRTSAVAIAAGFAAILLPYSLIGPYLGVFLDRWSRRSIVWLANLSRAALVLPAAACIWFGQDSIVLFVLILMIIGLNRFFLAGLSAATPHVVADRMLVTANSVSATLGSIVFSVGLGGAALLVQTALSASFHGYAVVAASAAVLYTCSGLLGRSSYEPDALGPDVTQRRPEPILVAVVQVARSTVHGLRHLAGRRGAAYLVAAQGAYRALYGVLLIDTLLLYRAVFNTSRDVTGSFGALAGAFAAGGAGLLVAAFCTPPIARRVGGWRWVSGLLAAAGAAVFFFGLPFDPVAMLGAMFVVGVASQGIKIVVDTALQHECDDDYRGRVFAFNDTVFNVALVIGMYCGALVLPDSGVAPIVLSVIAAGFVLVSAGYAALGGRWANRAGDDIAEPERTPPAEVLTRSS